MYWVQSSRMIHGSTFVLDQLVDKIAALSYGSITPPSSPDPVKTMDLRTSLECQLTGPVNDGPANIHWISEPLLVVGLGLGLHS
jgi:hypothetical protein